MKLSVVIPCKNEVGVVDTLLSALADQTRPADEIIVVDSHSTDGTATHVQKVGKKLPLIVTPATKKGVAEARNHGGKKASGDVLLFLDADANLASNFLENFLAEKHRRKLQSGGFSQRMPSKSLGIRLGARVMNGYARIMQHTPWPIAFSVIFCDRVVFKKLGGFDAEIFIMEDYDFVYRSKKAGFRVGTISTPFYSSDRRFVGPDSPSIWRGVYAELYRYTHGMRITKPLFEYEMGGKPKKTNQASSKNDR
jgi:glycosyltransferase involved in cell wall biosynthesis